MAARQSAGASNGTVFRVPRHDNFTVISNKHLRDPNLSFKARGLLTTILSLPPDWDYTLKGLAACAADSISSTRSGISELEKNGYVHRVQKRQTDGTWAKMEYQVYEDPAENPFFSEQDAEPVCENPISDSPKSENRRQINTYQTKYLQNETLSHSFSHESAADTCTRMDEGVSENAELPKGCCGILRAVGYTGVLEDTDAETAEMIDCCGLDADLLMQCQIPYSFSQSTELMKQTLELLSVAGYTLDDTTRRQFDSFLSVLSDMACMQTAVYQGQKVRYHQVIDRINRHIAEIGGLYDWLCGFDEEWQRILRERGSEIRHIARYMRSCLWQWLNDSSIIADGIDRMFI